MKMMNAVSVKMQHSIFAELVLSLFAFYIVQCRIHSRIMKAIEFINPETIDARIKFLSVLIVDTGSELQSHIEIEHTQVSSLTLCSTVSSESEKLLVDETDNF